MSQDVEMLPVVAIQSKIGGHPAKATMILYDLIDKPVREPILRPDKLHLPFAIRLGEERGAKGEDAKE
jgi:hypothetical protein